MLLSTIKIHQKVYSFTYIFLYIHSFNPYKSCCTEAERLCNFKVYTVKPNINFNIQSTSSSDTDLVDHVKGRVERNAIVDLYPMFSRSQYSKYVLIEKQDTYNPITKLYNDGYLIVKEVMIEGFYYCMSFSIQIIQIYNIFIFMFCLFMLNLL